MKHIVSLFFVFILLPMVACTSNTISTVVVPARIIDESAASRSALQRAVSAALNLSRILLRDGALTKSNVLIIERKYLTGLSLDKPKVFRLVKSGNRCILLLQGTNKRWILQNTRCEQVKPPLRVDKTIKGYLINSNRT